MVNNAKMFDGSPREYRSFIRNLNLGVNRSVDLTTNQQRLINASVSIMTRAIQAIQPLLPSFQSLVVPGAHPFFLARGDKMPHPIVAPRSIGNVVAGPIMIPCPM